MRSGNLQNKFLNPGELILYLDPIETHLNLI